MNEISSAPEVIQSQRRTRYTLEFKLRIVEASFAPGASIARVARDHDLNSNQLFNWRYQYRKGLLGPMTTPALMLPVTVSDSAPPRRPPLTPPTVNLMELTLAKGQLRIQGRPDADTLRQVLLALIS